MPEQAQGIVLLCRNDRWGAAAAEIATRRFVANLTVLMQDSDGFDPEAIRDVSPEVLLSYCITWIVPPDLLEAMVTPINFHPGSADYPGVGCYNFALYEGASEFGVVCHRMADRPDTGPIIEERRFSIEGDETVERLKLSTMTALLTLFEDIIEQLAKGAPLLASPARWSRRPFTRKELNALCVVTPDMPPEEIKRRHRAVTYPGYPGLRMTVGGTTFFAEVPDRPPIA